MTESLLRKDEVSRAQVGPRQLKDPRSREYAIQTLCALKRYAESLRCDQELVAKEIAVVDQYRHWEVLGYVSKEAMFAAELSDVGLANVHKAQGAAIQAAQMDVLTEWGEVGRGRNRVDNINSKTTGGTSQSYLTRRLRRDHPAIFEQLKAGGYRSVRAAAKDAGIVRDKTPLQQLQHWWAKASTKEQREFRAWLRTT